MSEVAAVAEKYDDFADLGIEVLGMSIDTPFVHKVWNDKEISKLIDKDIPYPLLTDQGGRVGSLYGVYDEEEGVDLRGRFIIDPEGIVQSYEIVTAPVGRNFREALRQFKALQKVVETKGEEVMPADWEPGKKTLKPGAELVGKVWEELKGE